MSNDRSLTRDLAQVPGLSPEARQRAEQLATSRDVYAYTAGPEQRWFIWIQAPSAMYESRWTVRAWNLNVEGIHSQTPPDLCMCTNCQIYRWRAAAQRQGGQQA